MPYACSQSERDELLTAYISRLKTGDMGPTRFRAACAAIGLNATETDELVKLYLLPRAEE